MEKLIKFDKQSVSFELLYKMKCRDNFVLGFNYLASKLPLKKVGNLAKMKWSEGKNYNWIGLKQDDVIFLVRQYRNHFTIYFKSVYFKVNKFSRSKYGCFTFNTDTDMLSDDESDKRCDNQFIDLNEHIKRLFEVVKENKVHSIWNDYSYEREKYIKLKNVWNGGEDISNLEDFIFAMEELSSKFSETFAETDMVEKLKTIKVGQTIGKYKVKEVVTTVKDGYYHGVGLDVEGHYFMDVYFLTRWQLNDMFTKEEQDALLEPFEY